MRVIKATASFGFIGAEYEKEFEFDDETTDEEIEDEIYQWACEYVDTDWEEE